MRLPLILSLLFSLSLLSCDGFNSASNRGGSAPPAAPAGYDATSSTLQLSGATAKQVVLENGLKVILISAPTSKTASAAVGVRVGHRDNPRHLQGLAHFLEHMLFLGTEEFPVVGEYSQFLRTHGGSSNAYTSGDHTNYYLQIQADKFEEATHRMSRFFVNPLFDASYVEREKNAVHNEYNMRLLAFKQNRPLTAFLTQDDPNRLFSIGNNVTLKDATAQDTKDMFERYYYAQAMHAVLAGPQGLDVLENWANKYFSDIPSKQQSVTKFDPFIKIDESLLPAQVNFKADGEDRFLRIFIPVKDPKEENIKLLSSIGLLFGDESEDSLMVALQKQGFLRLGANSLSGGASHAGISATLQLTELGVAQYKDVINYVKGYLDFLMQSGLPGYVNEELKSLEATDALSKEYYELAADLIQDMNRKYFSSDWMPKNWHELFLGRVYQDVTSKDFTGYLNRIRYDKIMVHLADPSFLEPAVNFDDHANLNQGGTSIIEQDGKKILVDYLYNFSAEVLEFDPALIQAAGAFTMKKANLYLPQSFEIYPDENTEIYSKISGDWGEIRYNATPKVSTPKTFVSLNLVSSGIDRNDPKSVAAMFLLREMMRNQTASTSYAMTTAGFEINYPIYVDKGVIALDISGWSDTFLDVLEDTLSKLTFETSDEDFAILKSFYRQKISQEQAGDIGAIGSRSALSMITPAYLDYADLYQGIDDLSADQFRKFVVDYLSAFHIQGVLTGNLKQSYVQSIVDALNRYWQPTWNLTKPSLDSNLEGLDERGNPKLFVKQLAGPDRQNSLYMGYWDLGRNLSAKDKWLAKIFGAWIYPDYYEELRTQRQLAYSLYAVHSEFMKHQFLVVNLMSSTHDAAQIETEVDSYVKNWVTELLPTKTEALLQSTVTNFVLNADLPQAPKALHTLIKNFVSDEYDTLAEVQANLDVLRSITVLDVVDFGERNFKQTPKRGSFVKIQKRSN